MTAYACPDCDGQVENCLPDGHNQLYISKKLRKSDEFGSGGEAAMVCWNCNRVFKRSDCRVWKGATND